MEHPFSYRALLGWIYDPAHQLSRRFKRHLDVHVETETGWHFAGLSLWQHLKSRSPRFVDSHAAVPFRWDSPPRGGQARPSLFLLRVARCAAAELQPMQLALFGAHRAQRRLATEEPAEVQADVRRRHPIAVHRQLAAFILADAQAPNLRFRLLLHLRPRTARSEALATRLKNCVAS